MAYATGMMGATNSAVNNYPPTAAPKTLSSAGSRLENLNSRLAKAAEELGTIASQIGSAHPVADTPPANGQAAGGAVYRLNDLADDAHSRMNDIENLIAGIQRSLG